MKGYLLAIGLLLGFGQMATAEVLFSGGAVKETAPTVATAKAVTSASPKRHAADSKLASFCLSDATYCLVADSKQNRLHLFQGGEGVMAWDVIMLPPGRVLRGYITQIDLNPSWCPPASVRRKFPNLPAGCLPPGHRLNAMGEVKIIMNGDFEGTAIRIHDTRAFGSDWPNEDSSGCVRVLNLKSEVLPKIGHGREGQVEVVFR
jgi:L,D-transpeptidase catalytic domain